MASCFFIFASVISCIIIATKSKPTGDHSKFLTDEVPTSRSPSAFRAELETESSESEEEFIKQLNCNESLTEPTDSEPTRGIAKRLSSRLQQFKKKVVGKLTKRTSHSQTDNEESTPLLSSSEIDESEYEQQGEGTRTSSQHQCCTSTSGYYLHLPPDGIFPINFHF